MEDADDIVCPDLECSDGLCCLIRKSVFFYRFPCVAALALNLPLLTRKPLSPPSFHVSFPSLSARDPNFVRPQTLRRSCFCTATNTEGTTSEPATAGTTSDNTVSSTDSPATIEGNA